jgi:hypothetical protein
MWRQYRKIEPKEFLLFSVDTASGGGDYTTCQVLSKTKIDAPLVYQSKVTTSDFIPNLVQTLNKVFDITGVKPVVCFERNNGGAFLIERVAGLNMAGKYEVFLMPKYGNEANGEASLLGWSTNTATRPKMLQELKDAMDKKLIKIYDRQTIMECLSFIIVKTSSSWKAQAERKAHDDLVMALAIAWQMYQICAPQTSVQADYSQYEHYKQPKVYDLL